MSMKIIERVGRLCLCALLCMVLAVPLMGTAFAFDGSGGEGTTPDITIRITPPSGLAVQSAAVEICITDNAGNGFQTAHVKAGSGNWKKVTGALEQTENRHYCVVDIAENCTVSVRVAGQDGTIFAKSEYINCFQAASSTNSAGTSTEPDTASLSSAMTAPGGQGTVIDNVVSGETREFFTISTPDENVFYLVIDRERENENVYFLNAVTESDLMALAEKDEAQNTPGVSAIPDPKPVCTCVDKCAPGEVDAGCPVCALSWKDCAGIVAADPADDGDTEPEPPKKGGGTGTIIIVLIVALAAGGAGYYFKIYKPKKATEDIDDFDDMDGAEEATINEDDEEPAPRRDHNAEPEEPDYPEGYGYEEPEDEE